MVFIFLQYFLMYVGHRQDHHKGCTSHKHQHPGGSLQGRLPRLWFTSIHAHAGIFLPHEAE